MAEVFPRGWIYTPVDLHRLMWVVIFLYLPVDCLNGFMVQQLGIDIKLAQLYKSAMTLLALMCLLTMQSATVRWIMIIFLLLLTGPFFRLVTEQSTTFTLVELPSATRVLMLMSVLCFAWESFSQCPDIARRWSVRTFWTGALLLSVNVLIGYIGLGFYTYDSSDIGFKGYFQAGNEVSAVFGLLCCFILHEVWRRQGMVLYVLVSLLCIFIGVSIATKAAVMFAFLAAFLTPLFSLRKQLFTFRVTLLILLLIAMLISAAIWLFVTFEELPFIQRVMFVFEQLGFWGVVLSKRDELVVIYFDALLQGNVIKGLLLGTGSDALMLARERLYVEIDPLDTLMYFGAVIASVFLFFTYLSLYLPVKWLDSREYAPCVLLANFCFLFFACIAGHVWMSGMLVGVWGTFFALLKIPKYAGVKR